MSIKVKISPDFRNWKDGVVEIVLNDFEDFEYVIREKLLDHPYMVYRGHRSAEWPLRTTIDRLFIEQVGRCPTTEEAEKHLLGFKYACRGRLHSDWVPSDDNSWWSLGQHFGLATPLLDWTESPYVAAYFSFSEKTEDFESAQRIIYALDPIEVDKKNKELDPEQRLEVIRPLIDQNPRLVNQRGLFTKNPLGVDVENWVLTHFKGTDGIGVLIKVVIPEEEGHREKFLRLLNRKNINPLTLFPDLTGSSQQANNNIVIGNY
ncbi:MULTISPECIES: FRG domain-containing protein [Vibrio harveyi group]|uniref:FRG domain-containing protein n=1 Tax=Vibrio diabolicus TaxID=50719 RepID=A0ABN5HFW7_9VIBR|nr:FRG domain-containing protein [Vibrio diabolicus]AVH25887.1 FRG domain-containing protein [Vibrio diabolicus]EGQ9283879.1 FRG domain-containing protein [Vibrio vulnificus]